MITFKENVSSMDNYPGAPEVSGNPWDLYDTVGLSIAGEVVEGAVYRVSLHSSKVMLSLSDEKWTC